MPSRSPARRANRRISQVLRTLSERAASRAAAQSNVEVKGKGTLRFHNLKSVRHDRGHLVAVSRSGEVGVIDDFGRERERYRIPYGSVIGVDEGNIELLGEAPTEGVLDAVVGCDVSSCGSR